MPFGAETRKGSPRAARLEPGGGFIAAIVVAEMLFEEAGSLRGLLLGIQSSRLII
jgi:hypothetical protein